MAGLGIPQFLMIGSGVIQALNVRHAYGTANRDAVKSLQHSNQEIEYINIDRQRQLEAINGQTAAELIKFKATQYDIARQTRARSATLEASLGAAALNSGSYQLALIDVQRDGLEISQRHEQNLGFRLEQLGAERTDVELEAAGLKRKSRGKIKEGGSAAGAALSLASIIGDTGLQVGFTTDPDTGQLIPRI